MPLKRRRFLSTLASGGGALLLAQCKSTAKPPAPHEEPSQEPKPAGFKVIVVGAGIAGIRCARSLHSEGVEVVVLEGRDRTGGRIFTDRSLGFPIERGANWIEGRNGNPIAEAAKAAKIKTVLDDSEEAFYAHDGLLLGTKKLAALQEINEEFREGLAAVADEYEKDVSIEMAVKRLIKGERLSAFEKQAVNFVMATLELDTAGAMDRTSLWEADEGEAFSGESLFLPGGYDQIVDSLATGLDIRLSEDVKQIKADDHGVHVSTSKGEHQADAVVVSVPLGVLKNKGIRFRPGLSKRKKQAIDRLEMGTLNKVILRFPRAFWPADVGTFFYISKTRGEFPEIVDWNQVAGQPALLLFQGGAFAKNAERWSDAESVDRAMKVVRTCFGADSPDPDAFLVQRWNADPWTHGSYSFLTTGSTPKDRDALAAPEGERIYFCGEATHRDYPATVHGAYLSGEREAKRIIKAAKG